MITIKTMEQIDRMRKAGRLLALCHQQITRRIRPGVTTREIDSFVEQFLDKHGAIPEQKGYMGYPYATCASVNDVICHGFPNDQPLKNGDIVTIDMVVNLNGWLADSAWSYAVGIVSPRARKLLRTTLRALEAGIRQAVIGNRIGDIGHAIQLLAEKEGFSVVRQFTGHGIGQRIHEEPEVPHFGRPGTGRLLEKGMVITIEPMLNMGGWHTKIDPNGWSARTADGQWSAQYEHTVAITSDGPQILTKL
jgi:methionyl aminopeptidase